MKDIIGNVVHGNSNNYPPSKTHGRHPMMFTQRHKGNRWGNGFGIWHLNVLRQMFMFLRSPCGQLSLSLRECKPRRMNRFQVSMTVSFQEFIQGARNVWEWHPGVLSGLNIFPFHKVLETSSRFTNLENLFNGSRNVIMLNVDMRWGQSWLTLNVQWGKVRFKEVNVQDRVKTRERWRKFE